MYASALLLRENGAGQGIPALAGRWLFRTEIIAKEI
jgi:hypothetical protein